MPPKATEPHPFLSAMQRDFAARLSWSRIADVRKANHNPQIKLRGGTVRTARPSDVLTFGAVTKDRDGDEVLVKWWIWKEAGDASLSQTAGATTTLKTPQDARVGQTIHLVADATDDGVPALTRYGKVIVTIVLRAGTFANGFGRSRDSTRHRRVIGG